MATETQQGALEPVWVWGLPLAPLTFGQTLDKIDDLIRAGKPTYFITANLHYAMLTSRDRRLDPVNRGAVMVLADGMPLVWASRWRPQRLPERVAGSDLVPALCGRAAERGYRVFFLGGAPGIAEEAARKMCERFPGLLMAGIESPPFRPLSAEEEADLIAKIRNSRADLLFVAFGQPRGELWLAEHHQALGVPVSAQIGATLDFLAGRMRRSPRWLQRVGLEWAYRMYQEPKRLALRYWQNGLFAFRMLGRDFLSLFRRRPGLPENQRPPGP
jgi:N-acetylglucosaminyldiphosphoundecaprenol N-acetyl-beta-D-mannosaminyltransferase